MELAGSNAERARSRTAVSVIPGAGATECGSIADWCFHAGTFNFGIARWRCARSIARHYLERAAGFPPLKFVPPWSDVERCLEDRVDWLLTDNLSRKCRETPCGCASILAKALRHAKLVWQSLGFLRALVFSDRKRQHCSRRGDQIPQVARPAEFGKVQADANSFGQGRGTSTRAGRDAGRCAVRQNQSFGAGAGMGGPRPIDCRERPLTLHALCERAHRSSADARFGSREAVMDLIATSDPASTRT